MEEVSKMDKNNVKMDQKDVILLALLGFSSLSLRGKNNKNYKNMVNRSVLGKFYYIQWRKK